MEPRPLPEPIPSPPETEDEVEPRLELLPVLDEPDAEVEEPEEAAPQTQDPRPHRCPELVYRYLPSVTVLQPRPAGVLYRPSDAADLPDGKPKHPRRLLQRELPRPTAPPRPTASTATPPSVPSPFMAEKEDRIAGRLREDRIAALRHDLGPRVDPLQARRYKRSLLLRV